MKSALSEETKMFAYAVIGGFSLLLLGGLIALLLAWLSCFSIRIGFVITIAATAIFVFGALGSVWLMGIFGNALRGTIEESEATIDKPEEEV